MSSRPTINEVSRMAGVSIKTVSRVVNNEKNVSEDTRRRVEEVIARLNFRPSVAARTLAGKKSFQVALLYDNPSPYYVYHIQAGVRQRCEELGYRMLLQPVDSTSADLVSNVVGLIDENHLDGLILSPPVTEVVALLDELDRRGLSYARIAPGVRPEVGCSAAMDDIAASREATEHLIALGHRAIAYIRGPENHVSSDQRCQGYADALEAHGLPVEAELRVGGDYSFASGQEAARVLLSREKRPTAIFAGNDDMAAGALAMAHEMGIDVPGELSIIGFDDTDLARALWPPLTTIRQPIRELAYAAADLMLAPRAEKRVMLDHALMVRPSTGAARG